MSGFTEEHRFLQDYLQDYFHDTPHAGIKGSTLRQFEGLHDIPIEEYLRLYTPIGYNYDAVKSKKYLAWLGQDQDELGGSDNLPDLLEQVLEHGLFASQVNVLAAGALLTYEIHLEGPDSQGRPHCFRRNLPARRNQPRLKARHQRG